MLFDAEILKELSYDPYFKVSFTYDNGVITIKRGYAEVVRKAPKPEITYDSETNDKIVDSDKDKLDLEILNLVIGYLFQREYPGL